MTEIIKQLKISCLFLIALTVVTGFFYPGFVTLFSNLFFPYQAGGSLILEKNKLMGSELIGQAFKEDRYFWSRPSATSPYSYNASSSSGSNLGPTNPALLEAFKERLIHLQKSHPAHRNAPPIDLLTSSASGLDPHITPASAFYQIHRIAKARNISEKKTSDLIEKFIEAPQFGFLGEARVNILKLNLVLDAISD